ncbi:MAG: sulfur oxidation c-type cytochrome SoxX [Pseudomonadales bacterium]|nr:sulfur oxidation c-type cytochrome SoxX [Pseudomonadales bacterium]
MIGSIYKKISYKQIGFKQVIILGTVLVFSGTAIAEETAVVERIKPLTERIKPLAERIKQGQAIAYDRNAGNCLSCHLVLGAELPGNVGPPLIQMKLRYPDRNVLASQISDAALTNPNTVMPPYGRHNILTEKEIELVVDFVHSI